MAAKYYCFPSYIAAYVARWPFNKDIWFVGLYCCGSLEVVYIKRQGCCGYRQGGAIRIRLKKRTSENILSLSSTLFWNICESVALSDLLGHPVSIRESQLECLHCLWHRVISLCPDRDKNMRWNFLQSAFALMVLKPRTPLNLLNKHREKMRVPMKSPQFTCTRAVNKQGRDTSFEC